MTISKKNPTTPLWLSVARVGLAGLILLAIIIQGRQSLGNGFPLSHFVSYFTIQSNLFAAAVLFWGGALQFRGLPKARRDVIRGAAVLYLSVTGVVYGVLLAGYQEELQTTIPWVDTVLHRIIPLALVADWLLEPPDYAFSLNTKYLWLIYPVAYVTYSLIRGAMVGWYPYPFLDPSQPGGYSTVIAYAVGIAIFALFLAAVINLIGQRVRITVG